MANKKTSANKPDDKTSSTAGAGKNTSGSSKTKGETGKARADRAGASKPDTTSSATAPKPATRHSATTKPAPIIEGEAKRVSTKQADTTPSNNTHSTKSDARSAKPADGKSAETKPAAAKTTSTPQTSATKSAAAAASSATPRTASQRADAKAAPSVTPKVDPTTPSDTSIATGARPEDKNSVPSTHSADKSDTNAQAKPESAVKPAPEKAAPVTSKPDGRQSSGGFGKLALAALTGAVLALLGQYVITRYLVADDQAQTVTATADLEKRLQALEQAPAPQTALDTDAIDTRVQRQIAAALSERQGTDMPADEQILTLQTTLDAARTRIESLEKAEQDNLARIDRLDAALAALPAGEATNNDETQAAAALSTELSSNMDTLSGKVESLQTTVSDMQTNVTGLQERLDNQPQIDPELGAKVTALQETVSANKSAVEASFDELGKQLSANGEKLSGLETRLTDMDTRLDTRISELAATSESSLKAAEQAAKTANDELAANVSVLSQNTDERLAAFEDRLNNGADRAAARALAAAALKRDVDLGVPFSGTLDTLKNVSETPEAIAPLAAYAKTGVPTLPALQARFEALADDIRRSVAPPPADDSLTSRLLAGARSAITVRRSGDTGTGIERTIRTIETALANGDIDAADTAWQTLPEPAQTISQDWHKDLSARQTADRLVSDVVDASLRASAPAQSMQTGAGESAPEQAPQPQPAEGDKSVTDASTDQAPQDQ